MKAKTQHTCSVLDMDAISRDIESPDETIRARAARALCPCRSGWELFEAYLLLVRQLQKDPSPMVRAIAIHVFEDADEMKSEGLPTNPREVHNEMLRTKRASRFARDPDELAQMQQQRNKTRRGQRDAG